MTKLFGYKRTLILLAFAGLGFVEANESTPLTSAEADAIIAQREAAKIERQIARLAELEKAEVLSEGEGTLPDGRKVIIREVRPPEIAEVPLAPSSIDQELKDPEFTAEQLAWIDAQEKLQSRKVQMLSCTVYDRSITEVRWTYEEEIYFAYTNADFNYLRGVMTVETDTDSYDFFMGIGDVSEDAGYDLPLGLSAFSSGRSEYVLLKGDPSNTSATAGLEALLAYYDANLERLKIAYHRREALNAAQKRYKEANPEPKEDFIMQFWVPGKKGAGE